MRCLVPSWKLELRRENLLCLPRSFIFASLGLGCSKRQQVIVFVTVVNVCLVLVTGLGVMVLVDVMVAGWSYKLVEQLKEVTVVVFESVFVITLGGGVTVEKISLVV